MLEIGQSLNGKYKFLYEIGKGGMSRVYLALEEANNKIWAIKTIDKSSLENHRLVKESIDTEIRILSKLKGSYLPEIEEVIETDKEYFIVMEYIEGKTLEKIIKEKEIFTVEEVANIAKQIGKVLNYLHSQNPPVIYRDLKPSNIIKKKDGSIALIDFGAAREYDSTKLEDTVCLGTRGYAAPEQFGGMGQTDARTDIYALGVIMYYMLTGKSPNKPPYEIYPIRYWNKELSAGMEKIIIKCTKANPEERYKNVKDVIWELERYADYDRMIIWKYINKIIVK